MFRLLLNICSFSLFLSFLCRSKEAGGSGDDSSHIRFFSFSLIEGYISLVMDEQTTQRCDSKHTTRHGTEGDEGGGGAEKSASRVKLQEVLWKDELSSVLRSISRVLNTSVLLFTFWIVMMSRCFIETMMVSG